MTGIVDQDAAVVVGLVGDLQTGIHIFRPTAREMTIEEAAGEVEGGTETAAGVGTGMIGVGSVGSAWNVWIGGTGEIVANAGTGDMEVGAEYTEARAGTASPQGCIAGRLVGERQPHNCAFAGALYVCLMEHFLIVLAPCYLR